MNLVVILKMGDEVLLERVERTFGRCKESPKVGRG